MKQTTKVLLSAVLTIAMCLSVISGATFALFTSETKTNIAVTSGTVKVTASIDEESLALYSMDEAQTDGFENGGTAEFDTVEDVPTLVLTNVAPGDKATFSINVKNDSNIAIMYRFAWTVEGDLSGALTATVDGEALASGVSQWREWGISDATEKTLEIAIELPVATENDYQNKTASISFAVEAVQGNGVAELGGTQYVDDAAGLQDALNNGGTVVLNQDIDLTGTATLAANNVNQPAVVMLAAIDELEDTSADTVTLTVPEGKTVELDLNGKKITSTSTAIENNGTLKLLGLGAVNASAAYAIVNNGDLTVEKATVSGVSAEAGTVILNGGVYESNGTNEALIYVGAGASVTVNGGTFEAAEDANIFAYGEKAAEADANGTLTVNDGTFAGKLTASADVTTTVKGGDFDVTVEVQEDQALSIEGGEFKGEIPESALGEDNKTVTVNGVNMVVSKDTSVVTNITEFWAAMSDTAVANIKMMAGTYDFSGKSCRRCHSANNYACPINAGCTNSGLHIWRAVNIIGSGADNTEIVVNTGTFDLSGEQYPINSQYFIYVSADNVSFSDLTITNACTTAYTTLRVVDEDAPLTHKIANFTLKNVHFQSATGAKCKYDVHLYYAENAVFENVTSSSSAWSKLNTQNRSTYTGSITRE